MSDVLEGRGTLLYNGSLKEDSTGIIKTINEKTKTITKVKELAKTTIKKNLTQITISERVKADSSGKIVTNAKNVYYKITTKDNLKLADVIKYYETHKLDKELNTKYNDLFATIYESDDVKKKKTAYLTKNGDGTYTLVTTRNVRSLGNWITEHNYKDFNTNEIMDKLNSQISKTNAHLSFQKKKTTTTKTTTINKKTTISSSGLSDIYINHSYVNQTIAKFDNIVDILSQSNNRIKSLMSDAANYWQGTAATLCYKKVEEYMEQIKKYVNYIEDKSNNLKKCSESYQDFDEKFKGLRID